VPFLSRLSPAVTLTSQTFVFLDALPMFILTPHNGLCSLPKHGKASFWVMLSTLQPRLSITPLLKKSSGPATSPSTRTGFPPLSLLHSGELISLPTSPSGDSGEPLHFLIAFDDFEDDPFVPHPTAVVPSFAKISARQQADKVALIMRRATSPR
jgi:hypothetical protein